jgi:hypothetical protein
LRCEINGSALKMAANNRFLDMRPLIICLSLAILACEGKLTDEQRKKMKEQMELHKIKKVSEAEITEAAYAEGRKLTSLIEGFGRDSSRIDSLMTKNASVRFIKPGEKNGMLLERQLIEAYLADESGEMQDNVQRKRNDGQPGDSILYTKPVVIKNNDGSEELIGVWNIWLSQKELIIRMDK